VHRLLVRQISSGIFRLTSVFISAGLRDGGDAVADAFGVEYVNGVLDLSGPPVSPA